MSDIDKLLKIAGSFEKLSAGGHVSGRDVQERLMEEGKGMEETPMGGTEYDPKQIREEELLSTGPGAPLLDSILGTQIGGMFIDSGQPVPRFIEIFIDQSSVGVFEFNEIFSKYEKLHQPSNLIRQVGLSSDDVKMLFNLHFSALKEQEKEFYEAKRKEMESEPAEKGKKKKRRRIVEQQPTEEVSGPPEMEMKME